MNMEQPDTPACPLTRFILLIPQQSGQGTISLSARGVLGGGAGGAMSLMSLVIGVTINSTLL